VARIVEAYDKAGAQAAAVRDGRHRP